MRKIGKKIAGIIANTGKKKEVNGGRKLRRSRRAGEIFWSNNIGLSNKSVASPSCLPPNPALSPNAGERMRARGVKKDRA